MIYDLPGFSTRPKWIQNEDMTDEDRKFNKIMQMGEDRSARWMRGNRNIIIRLREQREELMHGERKEEVSFCEENKYLLYCIITLLVTYFMHTTFIGMSMMPRLSSSNMHSADCVVMAYSIITVAFIIHHLYQILKSMMDQLSNK